MRHWWQPIRRWSLLVSVATIAVTPSSGVAAPSVEQGRALFEAKCIACHTIGRGDLVGPDLAGVASRRDGEWLARWLAAPDRLLAQGDPIAKDLLAKYRNVPMPNQGLTRDEVAAVVAYLSASEASAAVPTGTAGAALVGDAAVGKELFTGTRRFANQGPPCMACHSIAGVGALGGGALGPDLTTAASKFGPGLASVLASLPFPTMTPIFTNRPLTPDEQAHLRAFIGQATVAARSPQAIGQLTVLAVVGAALGLGLAHVTWRRRLNGGVRRAVLARSHRTPGGRGR